VVRKAADYMTKNRNMTGQEIARNTLENRHAKE